MRSIVFLVLLFGVNMASFGQSDSLKLRFDELMNKSESYQQFKVVRGSSLQGFFNETQDTLAIYQSKVSRLKRELNATTSESKRIQDEKLAIQIALDETTSKLGAITFVGLELKTGTYHFIVWGIIVLLMALSIMVYSLYLKSNQVTKESSHNFKSLFEEFEEYKDRTRAKEVKIKRELQTTLNSLDECRRGTKK
jgi:hypothetical protein